MQQTLLEAYQARNRFPLDALRQAAWLRRALANNLADEIRKRVSRGKHRLEEQSLEEALEASSARLESWLAREQSTPYGRAARREELSRMAQALLCLPHDQRQAIELHHLQGLSLAEVGRCLGRSREAAAGLVFRGLKTLRTLLSDNRGTST